MQFLFVLLTSFISTKSVDSQASSALKSFAEQAKILNGLVKKDSKAEAAKQNKILLQDLNKLKAESKAVQKANVSKLEDKKGDNAVAAKNDAEESSSSSSEDTEILAKSFPKSQQKSTEQSYVEEETRNKVKNPNYAANLQNSGNSEQLKRPEEKTNTMSKTDNPLISESKAKNSLKDISDEIQMESLLTKDLSVMKSGAKEEETGSFNVLEDEDKKNPEKDEKSKTEEETKPKTEAEEKEEKKPKTEEEKKDKKSNIEDETKPKENPKEKTTPKTQQKVKAKNNKQIKSSKLANKDKNVEKGGKKSNLHLKNEKKSSSLTSKKSNLKVKKSNSFSEKKQKSKISTKNSLKKKNNKK